MIEEKYSPSKTMKGKKFGKLEVDLEVFADGSGSIDVTANTEDGEDVVFSQSSGKVSDWAQKMEREMNKSLKYYSSDVKKIVSALKKMNMSEEEIQEASQAQASMKPNPRASKSELLSQMMKVFGGMKKEDLSKFLTDTLSQVGKESDTVPDYSGKNMSSVNMTGGSTMPSPVTGAMREDVQELFGDDETLSEEFKDKASTLFEASVSNRVNLEVARLEEEVETQLTEKVTEEIETLHEQVDKYMSYVVEQWMQENEVAIEDSFRSNISENFMVGLKNLFTENYVDVPEDKVDLVAELQESVESLQEQLESVQVENVELNNMIREARLEVVFDEVAEGLAETQIENLRSLAEGVEFDSIEEYENKLNIIKNQYFKEGVSTSSSYTGLIDEETSVGSNDFNEEQVVPAEMKTYFNAISKTIKK